MLAQKTKLSSEKALQGFTEIAQEEAHVRFAFCADLLEMLI